MSDIKRIRDLALDGDDDALQSWLRESLRSGERGACLEILELLLTRWRSTPTAELAHAISGLSHAIESDEARALRDPKMKKVSLSAWNAVEAPGDIADRGALLAALSRGRTGDIGVWLTQVETWPRDPRIADTLCGWLLELPFRSTSSRSAWGTALRILKAQQDPRSATRLAPIVEPQWLWPCGETMQRWFEKQAPKLLKALKTFAAPAAEPQPGIAAIGEMMEHGVELFSVAPKKPAPREPDPLADRLEEALAEPPSARSWGVICTELDRLHQTGALDDKTLEKARVATADWPTELCTVPRAWWKTLVRKSKPMAHPVFSLAKSIPLNRGFRKAHVPPAKLNVLLSRPQAAHLELVRLPSWMVAESGAALSRHSTRLEFGRFSAQSMTNEALEQLLEHRLIGRLEPFAILAGMKKELLERVVADPDHNTLRQLRLSELTPGVLEVISQGSWDGLESLSLYTEYSGKVLPLLVESPLWQRIRELSVDLRKLTQPTLERLAAAPLPPRLMSLRLRYVHPHDPQLTTGLARFVEKLAPQLTELNVSLSADPSGALEAAIAACPRLERLSLLNAAHSSVFLDEMPLGALQELQFMGGGENTGARLARLTEEARALETEELQPLFASHHVKSMRALSLSGGRLGLPEARAIAAAPLERIERLDLSWNRIPFEGAEALARSALLRRRLHRSIEVKPYAIDLTGNPITPSGHALLKEAFGKGPQPRST